jgi:hypothetical protein
MRKRQDSSASLDDDGPKLISLQDKHDADRLLHQAYAAGQMDEEELKRRRGRVYAAVTHATSGRRAATGPGRADGPTRPTSGARCGSSWPSWSSPP